MPFIREIKKALLINPPTGIYDRFERCQAPVETETVELIRPPMDLLYYGAVLQNNRAEVLIRDYPTEKKDWADLADDIKSYSPDMLLVSSTIPTEKEDCRAFQIAKNIDSGIICVIKGFFPDKGQKIFRENESLDYLFREESELSFAAFIGRTNLTEIKGLTYRNGSKIVTNDDSWVTDLDSLPYPARNLINNAAYKMPDNGNPMGLILVAKGCPYSCRFCLVPAVSGKTVRLRSTDSVLAEIIECVDRYGIKDFWFRADTFTVNKAWVLDFCRKVKNSNLNIRWATNSRVDTIDESLAAALKDAGCFSLGFGVESGSQKILDKMNKGITKEQIRKAVSICKKYKIQTYLFFVLGLPWETVEDINETISFARQLNGDVFNFSLATYFPGTDLYDFAVSAGLIDESKDYSGCDYGHPMTGTLYVSRQDLNALQKKAYRKILFRPGYIVQCLKNINNPQKIYWYAKSALRIFKQLT